MRKIAYISAGIVILALPLVPQLVGETTYYTSFAANFLFAHNLHEVVPKKLFRSAEMSRSDLEQTIKDHNIQTVIDLRLDEDAPDKSGKSEQQAVEESGGKYFHVPFSSARADQKEQIEKLLNIYDEARTPVLVHCSSGTHRAGFASAVWLLDKENAPVSTAEEQISLKYGFVKWERELKALLQGKPTLDAVITQYAESRGSGDLTFREWLENQQDLGAKK